MGATGRPHKNRHANVSCSKRSLCLSLLLLGLAFTVLFVPFVFHALPMSSSAVQPQAGGRKHRQHESVVLSRSEYNRNSQHSINGGDRAQTIGTGPRHTAETVFGEQPSHIDLPLHSKATHEWKDELKPQAAQSIQGAMLDVRGRLALTGAAEDNAARVAAKGQPLPAVRSFPPEVNQAGLEWWQDPQIYEVNKLPGHMGELPFETEALARLEDVGKARERSSRYVSLDGVWHMSWHSSTSKIPQNVSALESNPAAWKRVHLPANLEYPVLPPRHHDADAYAFPIYTNDKYPFRTARHRGWGPVIDDRRNPHAVYRRKVEVPTHWRGMRVYLHFGSVRSAMHLWVNGHLVGYSEGSKLPAEFDVTGLVAPGTSAVIVLRVLRFSTGAWMEDQDMWRLSGITRESFMYARPDVLMWDLGLNATCTSADYATGELSVTAVLEAPESVTGAELRLEIAVEDKSGTTVAVSRVPVGNFEEPSCTMLKDIDLYGSEIPNGMVELGTSKNDPDGFRRCSSACLKRPECTCFTSLNDWCYLKGNDDGAAPRRNLVSGVCTRSRQRTVHARLTVNSVAQWTAETPQLYRVIVRFTRHEQLLEVVSSEVGFRTIEILDGQLTVNGKPITIRGVNRHEHNLTTGQVVVTRDEMLRDIYLMKSLHVNAVRTSHYPNHLLWYRLCNKHGLYVFDEANVETHGSGWQRENALAGNPLWRGMHVNRARRMVERDKNFPSIIVWSLGNEAGTGDNLKRSYAWVKNRDRSRPVVYNFDGGDGYTDIVFPMYTAPKDLDDYAKGAPGLGGVYGAINRTQPLILCEYAHAMGNSLGNFAEYWHVIEQHKVLGGGFIWDWVDQALVASRPNVGNIMAYGGDFGPPDTPTDQNFLINGLVQADRRPSPQVWEMKKFYEPVTIRAPQHKRRGSSTFPKFVEIRNRKSFASLSEVARIDVLVRRNGRVIKTFLLNATVPVIQRLNPGESTRLRLPTARLQPGHEYVLEVQLWQDPRDHPHSSETLMGLQTTLDEIAWWQSQPVIVSRDTSRASSPPLVDRELRLTEVGEDWVVTGASFEISFSCVTGQMAGWRFDGERVSTASSTPSFWRAPTDNDYGYAFQQRCAAWRTAAFNRRRKSCSAKKVNTLIDGVRTQVVKFTSLFGLKLPTPVTYNATFVVHKSGHIQVHQHIYPTNKRWTSWMRSDVAYDPGDRCNSIPRVGWKIALPQGFNSVTWYGRGPHESYVDRNRSARLGQWGGVVREQLFPYVRPQETGNKVDVRWIGVSSTTKSIGIVAFVDHTMTPLSASALDVGEYDLDGGFVKSQQHAAEILHIDFRQTGLGGIDSWGRGPLDEYQIALPRRGLSYSFWLRPYRGSAEDAGDYVTDTPPCFGCIK